MMPPIFLTVSLYKIDIIHFIIFKRLVAMLNFFLDVSIYIIPVQVKN